MHECDKMIAELEAGGIISLDELKGFFWNTHHDNDHTNKLVAFDKKINGIDKLINMMKQRSQHSAIYNEYQERSTFADCGMLHNTDFDLCETVFECVNRLWRNNTTY